MISNRNLLSNLATIAICALIYLCIVIVMHTVFDINLFRVSYCMDGNSERNFNDSAFYKVVQMRDNSWRVWYKNVNVVYDISKQGPVDNPEFAAEYGNNWFRYKQVVTCSMHNDPEARFGPRDDIRAADDIKHAIRSQFNAIQEGLLHPNYYNYLNRNPHNKGFRGAGHIPIPAPSQDIFNRDILLLAAFHKPVSIFLNIVKDNFKYKNIYRVSIFTITVLLTSIYLYYGKGTLSENSTLVKQQIDASDSNKIKQHKLHEILSDRVSDSYKLVNSYSNLDTYDKNNRFNTTIYKYNIDKQISEIYNKHQSDQINKQTGKAYLDLNKNYSSTVEDAFHNSKNTSYENYDTYHTNDDNSKSNDNDNKDEKSARSPLDQFQIRDLISLDAPIIAHFHISITNIVLYLSISTYIILTLSFLTTNYNKIIAHNWSISQESIYATVHSIVINQINEKNGQSYYPFMYCLFIMILSSNLIGMVPYSFASTSHFVLTFFLSFTIVLGSTILGFLIHKLKFFSLFVPSGCPLGLLFLLVLIEFISYLARNVSLGLRLAANILSGHMLLNILSEFTYKIMETNILYLLLGIIPLMFIIAFSALELGIAFIQSQVFVVLSSSYVKDSLELH